MMRPYLYAKAMFQSRSKERGDIEEDKAFFQGFLAAVDSSKVLDFLRHPLVPQSLKYQSLERSLLSIDSFKGSHESLLKQWIGKDYFTRIPAVFAQWLILVEDFFQEGEILISSPVPLSLLAMESLQKIFHKKEPNRTFTFRYSKDLTGRATAQFRDCVLDLRPSVLLKKFILSLKEGF